MKILALEFSSERRSVAIAEGAEPGQVTILGYGCQAGSGQTHALGLVEAALRQAGIEREAIGCVAVGLGPGSYTGIRLAIALAQGWHLARGVRLLGVGSFDAVAAQAQAAGLRGQVQVVADAQRNEFYVATYQLTATDVRLVQPLRLATAQQIQQCAQAEELVVGPEAGRVVPNGQTLFPDAATLARLAAGRTDFVSGQHLEPIYLRPTTFVKAPPPRADV
jgi:tRNA threonylcarbamoyl adenosine modification protein YeaZ